MNLRNNILATLVYYDVFDFPLTGEEVFEYLVNLNNTSQLSNIKKEEVVECLAYLINNKKIFFEDGYYYLFERDYLVPLRLKREKIAKEKWRKVRRAVRWLGILPFVKTIFASGSLALNNTDELSDLDVLVVTKHGRIWTTRLLISGLLSLLRMRRKYNQRIAPDKICLNHYITDKSLLIPFKSIYNAQTYLNLRPIFVSDTKIVGNFFRANSWLNEYAINFNSEKLAIKSIGGGIRRGNFTKIVSKIAEVILNTKIGDWLEIWARKWQISRIERHRRHDPLGGRVIYNDNCLEFHPGSAEESLIRNYEFRIKNLRVGEKF